MLTIEELSRALTEDEILESWLTILETMQIPARSWVKAGKTRTLMRILARTMAAFSAVMAAFIRSGFLDTAEGDWLTLAAKNVYKVDRIPATFAREKVQLKNTGGGTFTKAIGEVTVLWEDGRKSYRNVESFVLGPLETLEVTFEAFEAGSASSVAAGGIRKLETVMTGVEVTNLVALVGSDEEKDPPLRQRCRDKLDTLSPFGPSGAYSYAVRSAKRLDGSPVDVNRVAQSPSSDTGLKTIYVASPSGPPVPTDLPFIATSIDELARPPDVRVTVLGATPVLVSRKFTAWARATSGVAESAVRVPAETALVALVADYPIGGIRKTPASSAYLFTDRMKAAIASAHPSIFDVDADDDADIPLAPGEIAVLAATIEVRFVEGSPT